MMRALVGLLLAVLALTGCQAANPSPTSGAATVTSSAVTSSAAVAACTEELPPEAREVIADIEAGGPYEYPRNDGVTFGNREGLLPDEDRGYYREFTVETPGLNHRGARRIVTGGPDERDPEHWYYTDDHYESFCEFLPDGR
jgi:ribonuclease T1